MYIAGYDPGMTSVIGDWTLDAFAQFDEGRTVREVADASGLTVDHVAALFHKYAEMLRAVAHDERFTRRAMMRAKVPIALDTLDRAARLPEAIDKAEAAAWGIKVKAASTLLAFASRHSEDDPITWNTERPAETKKRGKLTYHSIVRDDGATSLFAEWKPEGDEDDTRPQIVEAEVTFDATDLF